MSISDERQSEQYLDHQTNMIAFRNVQSILPPFGTTEYRTAIVLVDIVDVRCGEAAKIVGCSHGTVKRRVERERAQIRGYLRESPLVTMPAFRRRAFGYSEGSIDD